MCSADVLKLMTSDFLKLSEVFPGTTSGARARELKAWLVAKGIRDFEPVPLNCDKVGKVGSYIRLVPIRSHLTFECRRQSRKSRS